MTALIVTYYFTPFNSSSNISPNFAATGLGSSDTMYSAKHSANHSCASLVAYPLTSLRMSETFNPHDLITFGLKISRYNFRSVIIQ